MQTPQWMRNWYEAQPRGQVCRDCGETGDRAYVQPQPPRRKCDLSTWKPYALCLDCVMAINRRMDEARKAQLDTMPRCGVSGCKRRGSYRSCGVLLCGHHLKRAKAGHCRAQGAGGALALLIPMNYTGADVVRWATENPR